MAQQRQTVAEIPAFLRLAEKLLSDAEKIDLTSYLSEHPKAGDLIEGTGGIRKIRWGRGGRGKSAGVRIIYYYHSNEIPLYLLTIFSKGQKVNLSKAECKQLAEWVNTLVNTWIDREM